MAASIGWWVLLRAGRLQRATVANGNTRKVQTRPILCTGNRRDAVCRQLPELRGPVMGLQAPLSVLTAGKYNRQLQQLAVLHAYEVVVIIHIPHLKVTNYLKKMSIFQENLYFKLNSCLLALLLNKGRSP